MILMAACTAHYQINTRQRSIESVEQFKLGHRLGSQSNEILLILAFSGGGTGAAALSYPISTLSWP